MSPFLNIQREGKCLKFPCCSLSVKPGLLALANCFLLLNEERKDFTERELGASFAILLTAAIMDIITSVISEAQESFNHKQLESQLNVQHLRG